MKKSEIAEKNNKTSQRVIQFELNPNRQQEWILDSLTYAASKLWNVGNYERINWTGESGIPYPDWYDQKKRLKEHFWYKKLPSQTAQEVLKQLAEAWQSFYRLKQTGGVENPKPPRFKHNNFNIRYLNKGFQVENDVIRLAVPKDQKAFIKEKHCVDVSFLYIPVPEEYKGFEGNVKVIEIIPIPESDKYKVMIIIEFPENLYKQNNGVYMSIDLGINNLITCYVSNEKSLILSGRQLLSINRYFDKTISYYQSIAQAQQSVKGIKYSKSTERMNKLYSKRRKQVNHLLHTATKQVIEFAVKENVSKIIIGDISHIRGGKDMGKKNNQKSHRWPYRRIEDMLKYKAEDANISVEVQEESFTSQCNPYVDEVSEDTANKRNRKYRGLYKVDGRLLNADCVGAFNILKKYLQRTGLKPVTAVVGLDTPMMYGWDFKKGFVWNQKPAISIAA